MKTENKWKSILWITLFLIIICLPCLTWPIISGIMTTTNNENRNPAERPVISTENICDFSSQFENYFNDTLPYRNFLIECNASINYYIFKESPSDKVIVGKKGWLFYIDTLADYKKTNLYTDKELEEIRNNMLATKKFFDEKEIKFIVFIAPNKASIYGPEYLPHYILQCNEISRTQQLVDYIRQNTDITILFPEKELLAASYSAPDQPLYFHLDTHWNYLGGYYGTKALLKELDIDLPDCSKLNITPINEPIFLWNGYDLANMMGMTNILTEDINYAISGYSNTNVVYDQYIPTNEQAFNTFCRSHSNASDSRKIFFYRDSFGTSMMPYLASNFKEIYSTHFNYFKKEQIDEEHPDIFILEIVERKNINSHLIQNW